MPAVPERLGPGAGGARGANMADGVNKVVLAYSGGLDTSVILRWLQDHYRCEVVTFTADLGQGEELEPARAKAELMGVKQIYVEDLQEEFVRDFVFPMFRANALYEGCYLLGTSIARPLIAKRLIEIARRDRRRCVAHGATGKGNDQVRFELSATRSTRTSRSSPPGASGTSTARAQADRVRRGPADPDPARQARRAALFDRRQPSAHLLRGQGARGPVGRAGPRTMFTRTVVARGGARHADLCRARLRARRSGRGRRRAAVAGEPPAPAQRPRPAPTASAGSTWSRTASSA